MMITDNQVKKEEDQLPDHDTYWKKTIGFFFKEFIERLLPTLYKKIDWNKPIDFLEQEFHEIIKTKFKGKYLVDKLAKLYLKDGRKTFVLIHTEAQSTGEKIFKRRMFVYYSHIDYKFPEEDYEIVSLAIYTGKNVPKNSNIYKRGFAGTELSYKFNVCLVRDLEEEKLEKSTNPIDLVFLAAKYEHQSKGQYNKRFLFKKKLVNLLYERNYPADYIRLLMGFIRYVITLPEPLDDNFNQFLIQEINKKTMTLHPRQADIDWINTLYYSIYGMTPDEMYGKPYKEELERALAFQREVERLKKVTEKLKKEQEEAIQEAKMQEKIAQKIKEEQEKIAQKVKEEQEKAAQKVKEEQEKAAQKVKEEQEKKLDLAKDLVQDNIYSLEKVILKLNLSSEELIILKEKLLGK